jgi:hypothetical protein
VLERNAERERGRKGKKEEGEQNIYTCSRVVLNRCEFCLKR